MAGLETVTLDQRPRLAEVTPETLIASQPPGGAMARLPVADLAEFMRRSGSWSNQIWPTTAEAHVPRGIVGHGAITAGSGGANGTHLAVLAGGNFSVAPVIKLVVSGGALTQILIEHPGEYIGAAPTVPTINFAASVAGLTGAAAALTAGFIIPAGGRYMVRNSAGDRIRQFSNVAGAAQIVAPEVSFYSAAGLDTLFGTGSSLGTILTKTSAAPGAFGWATRNQMGDQPRLVVDTGVAGNRQLLTNFGAVFTNRFTSATVSGLLQITSVQAAVQTVMVASSAVPLVFGQIYRARGRFLVRPNGTAGIGAQVGILPYAPTNGAGAATITDASFTGLAYRASGSALAYERDGQTVDAAVTYAHATGVAWAAEEVTAIYEPADIFCTSGTLSWYVDGALVSRQPVTGLIANGWFCFGPRFGGAGEVFEVTGFEARAASLDVWRDLFVDFDTGVAAALRDGSTSAPFKTIKELQQEIDLDHKRKRFRVSISGALCEDASLTLDMDRLADVHLSGATGEQPVLRGAIPVAGGWTNIAGTPCWVRADPKYLGGNSTYGGWLETGAGVSQAFGRTGEFVMQGRRLLNRLAIDVAHNHASFIPGSYSRHTTGPYAGQWVLRCYDDGDPNTKSWLFSRHAHVVKAESVNPATRGRLRIDSGLILDAAFLNGLHAEGIWLYPDDITVRSTLLGYGVEANRTEGEANRVVVEGTAYDNYHASGIGATGERQYHFRWTDCAGRGAGSLPHGVGDNASNHQVHHWTWDRPEFIGAGKDAVSAVDNTEVIDPIISDAANAGFNLSGGTTAPNAKARLIGGVIRNCNHGVSLNGGAVDGTATQIDVEGVHLEGNAQTHLFGFTSGVGTNHRLNHRGCTMSGATPAQGEIKTTGVAVAGVLERLPLRSTVSWDIPSLAHGAGAGLEAALTGARPGDHVEVCASIDTQGLRLFGWVKAADLIALRAENNTGATIDLGVATITMVARRSVSA